MSSDIKGKKLVVRLVKEIKNILIANLMKHVEIRSAVRLKDKNEIPNKLLCILCKVVEKCVPRYHI